MTSESKKLLSPSFETALLVSAIPSEPQQNKTGPVSRFQLFYGAVHNLLSSFFQAHYAPRIPEKHFNIVCDITPKGFDIYVEFNPDDSHQLAELYNCGKRFFRDVCDANDVLELENVTACEVDYDGEPEFQIRIASDSELMQMLEHLLKPYNIKISTNFNHYTCLSEKPESELMEFSPLYSMPHVRALYRHANGDACMDEGMQLSH